MSFRKISSIFLTAIGSFVASITLLSLVGTSSAHAMSRETYQDTLASINPTSLIPIEFSSVVTSTLLRKR